MTSSISNAQRFCRTLLGSTLAVASLVICIAAVGKTRKQGGAPPPCLDTCAPCVQMADYDCGDSQYICYCHQCALCMGYSDTSTQYATCSNSPNNCNFCHGAGP